MFEMPCRDCERAIAELRAEFNALEQRHEQRQRAMLDAMKKAADNFEVKNQTLFATIDRYVQDLFTRLDALVARSTEKEEPPVCH